MLSCDTCNETFASMFNCIKHKVGKYRMRHFDYYTHEQLVKGPISAYTSIIRYTGIWSVTGYLLFESILLYLK
jgi:hypothetical protein